MVVIAPWSEIEYTGRFIDTIFAA